MNIEQYSKEKVTDKQLDTYLKAEQNVLLCGERGCGKTERILQCFVRNKLNYVYFSGPTMDPWIDFIGVPTEDDDGSLKFLRPARINPDLEAIFIDEYNRCPVEVANAVMELIQFKSINGIEFPKLKVVWASINPNKNISGQSYNVEDLDPAQLDRFHVIINIPNEPCDKWFKKTYKAKGEAAVRWWHDQSDLAKKTISSRRLAYALDSYEKGVALKYILPRSCANLKDLSLALNSDKSGTALRDLRKKPTLENYKRLVACKNHQDIASTFSDQTLMDLCEYAPKEIYSEELLNNKEFLKRVLDRQKSWSIALSSNEEEMIKEVCEAHPDHEHVKMIQTIKKEADEENEMFELENKILKQ